MKLLLIYLSSRRPFSQFERFIVSRTVDSLPGTLFGFDEEENSQDINEYHSYKQESRDMFTISSNALPFGSLQTVNVSVPFEDQPLTSKTLTDSDRCVINYNLNHLISDRVCRLNLTLCWYSAGSDEEDIEFDISEALTDRSFEAETSVTEYSWSALAFIYSMGSQLYDTTCFFTLSIL